MKSRIREAAKQINAVDLFCGAGGLTKGLKNAGINVRLGIDADPVCEYPYTRNNSSGFLRKSIEDVTAQDFSGILDKARFGLLAGCAPCQPFSTYTRGANTGTDGKWDLLGHFARLVDEAKPVLVTMENVPLLRKQKIFTEFIAKLDSEGFAVSHKVVNCADYGVPQHRRRLVLLASKLGKIELIEPAPDGRGASLEEAIANMPTLRDGEVCKSDPLHRSAGLSEINLRRIIASKPGGTWLDWDPELRADCHKRASGITYQNVYGRMSWDKLAPTITTQFTGFGSGRFGHPVQNRALSLREGAILQSFPKEYKFFPRHKPFSKSAIERMIGNAVPVKLGNVIGRSLARHVSKFCFN